MSKSQCFALGSVFSSILLALACGATGAAAQFRVDRYAAPPLPDDLLWTERASPGGETFAPFVRLAASFADDPRVARDAATGDEYVVIDEQAGFHLSAGPAIDFGQLYAALPLFTQDPASLPAGATATIDRAETTGLGDLRLGARCTLLKRDPIEVALAADLVLPTGSKSAAASDGKFGVQPRVIVSRALWARSFVSACL